MLVFHLELHQMIGNEVKSFSVTNPEIYTIPLERCHDSMSLISKKHYFSVKIMKLSSCFENSWTEKQRCFEIRDLSTLQGVQILQKNEKKQKSTSNGTKNVIFFVSCQKISISKNIFLRKSCLKGWSTFRDCSRP